MLGGSPADVPAVCRAGGRGGKGRWCEGTRRLNPTHCQSCLLPAGATVVSVLSDMRVRAEEQQENDSVSLLQLPAGALPDLSCTSLAAAESRGSVAVAQARSWRGAPGAGLLIPPMARVGVNPFPSGRRAGLAS